MNKFNKIYNILMENLTKQISPEAFQELKRETEEFLDNVENNQVLKQSDVDIHNKEQLADTISDTVLFGNDVKILEKFTNLINSLKLNFNELIISNLFFILKNDKRNFKAVIKYLNTRKENAKSVGINVEQTQTVTFVEISQLTGISLECLTKIAMIEGKKNGANIGPGEILLALVLKQGKLADSKGDVESGTNYRIEVKTNRGAIGLRKSKGAEVLDYLKLVIKSQLGLGLSKQLISKFDGRKWFNSAQFGTSNGLEALIAEQLEVLKQDNTYTKELPELQDFIIKILKTGIQKNLELTNYDWISTELFDDKRTY